MNKPETLITILAAITIIGIIILMALGKDLGTLSGIAFALVGYLTGRKQELIVGFFKNKVL